MSMKSQENPHLNVGAEGTVMGKAIGELLQVPKRRGTGPHWLALRTMGRIQTLFYEFLKDECFTAVT